MKKLFLLFFVFILFSCNKDNNEKNILKFGIVPFENSEDLIKNVSPLLNIISKGMNMEVKPYIAADYTGIIEAFRSNKLDAAFLPPASYVMGKKEADIKVILKSQRSGKPFYYGAIIVRKDSNINTLQDLKGKRIAFGDPISTSSHVFPKMLLLKNGINPDNDFSNVLFSGTHDSVVLSVYNKKVDAGATFTDDKEGKNGSWVRYLKPEQSKEIKILAVTEPIPSDSICVSSKMTEENANKLANVILEYTSTKEGSDMMKKLYKFDGYLKANDADYESVREAFELSGIDIKKQLNKK